MVMNTRIILPVIIAALLISSCGQKDPQAIYLQSTLPTGIIAQTTVFEFAFSRGVVPRDSVNQWTATQFVEFTPAIEGKFVWQDTARLVFSPDAVLPGDTKFKGRIKRDLLVQLAGATGYHGDEDFSFATEPFTLRTVDFFYDRITDRKTVGIRANLEFTYGVNSEDVGKYLRIQINGEKHTAFKVISAIRSKTIAVEIGEMKNFEEKKEVRIDLAEELISPETNTSIKMDKPFKATIPPLGDMQIHGHEFGFDGTLSWIDVRTSQEVELTRVQSFIELTPKRDYKIEKSAGMGFKMKGYFEPGTHFNLMIKQGLESVLGAKTKNAYEADIIIGNVKPSFRFASPAGVYMLLSGQKSIEVKTVNLSELQLRVSQIFQNNLVHFLDQGRHYDYDYYEDEDEGYSYRRKYRYSVGNYGRELDDKKISLGSATNKEISTQINLASYLRTDYKGFFLVEIANPAESWRSTAKLISISDLGIIIKRSSDELLVFVVSLESNKPVSGVQISLISTNNQIVATQRTDGDGVAKFQPLNDVMKDFNLKLITAEKGDDFNFLNLGDYRIESSRFDVGGKDDMHGKYDAFMYGDRNLYRPGETINLSGIVRILTQDLPKEMPVQIKVSNPRGTKVSEIRRTLNEEGAFEIQYPTQPTAITGEYRFDLYTGNDLFLSTYQTSVEEFVPDRMRLNLKPSKEKAEPGDKITFDLQALNFFGPPAAGRKFELEDKFDVLPFTSKTYPEFRFANDAVKKGPEDVHVNNGETDQEGTAKVTIDIPQDAASPGLLSLRGKVAVFDESGRPVHQVARVLVYPKKHYLGIHNPNPYYISPNTAMKIRLVAVDPSDKAIKGMRVKVEVIRQEWHSVLRMHQESGGLRYVSEQREIVESTQELTLVSGPLECTYSAKRSGDYIVRVSKAGDEGYNQFHFYAYSWATVDETSFAIDPEARVDIVLDKKSYVPGDKAKILFQTPFSGTMLVSVERNKVFTYKYLEVEKNTASMEFKVGDEHLPNVYVSAVLFRKIKDLNIPLLAGHGFVPLMVEKPENKLNVSISAPEKIRPRTKQKITVSVPGEKNVFLTLAAVDEGILQIKNYGTPDPYKYFYAKKSLQTETYDFFRDLIPEPQHKSSSGGGEDELTQRAGIPLATRFKPVALWSGIVKTNSDGNADVTLTIPEFNGELRLMALAYKSDRFGSNQKPMKVADPIIITPALPRFLSPNDVITMPITAFNTTDKAVTLNFTIETEGGITAMQQTASLELKGNQERFVSVILKTTNQIGKAVVRVKTKAFGDKYESITELPVRPASGFVMESTSGFAEGGKTITQDIPDVFLSYGRRGHVFVSPFPVANFAKELKHLVGYPHGCLEQTTSKAFPQIYLRDIALLMDPSILEKGSPSYFVNEAITKIVSMQMNDGAFAYWPGGNYANNWSTVYAAHFLIEAKKAGYAVPEQTITAACQALRKIAREKTTYDYSCYENNRITVKRIADKSAVYALYVLALIGQPEQSVMNYFRTAASLLTTDTRYLLGGAFALSGDRKTYLEIVPPQFSTEEAQRTSGYCYDSQIRANALILNILLETDPNNPNIARYMDYLAQMYKRYYWFSTQDNAFTLLGFGKAARRAGSTNLKGTLTIGDKKFAYDGGNKKFPIDEFGQKMTISLQGEGRVYYSMTTEGIRKDGKMRMEDKNLKVWREFYDRYGNLIPSNGVKQNSLVIVKLSIQSDVDELENVAITDLLPAGFEIENPRLTENTQYKFINSNDTPVYVDIRDDRINYYVNFTGDRRQTFYYLMRAVTQGEFVYAPVVAEAMYDGDYYSASGGGKIKIVE
jgi:alpha-2-macroglobulin